MPDVAPPERCQPISRKPAPDVRAGDFVEHRPAAPPLPLSGAARAEIIVWMRLREDRPLDLLALSMLADAGPPALFGHLSEFIPIPSVEVTLHYAAGVDAAESPWILGSFPNDRGAGRLHDRRGRALDTERRARCEDLPAAPDPHLPPGR